MSEYDRFPTSLWIFVADTFGFPVMMLSSDNVCGGDFGMLGRWTVVDNKRMHNTCFCVSGD